MSVSIPPEFVPLLDDLVAAGSYPSADAVVRDALDQLLKRRAQIDVLKASLQEAREEIERGEGVPFEVEEILAEGRRMHAQRHGG